MNALTAQAQGGGWRRVGGEETGGPSGRAQSLVLREETIRKVEEFERMRTPRRCQPKENHWAEPKGELSGHWITAESISAKLSQVSYGRWEKG